MAPTKVVNQEYSQTPHILAAELIVETRQLGVGVGFVVSLVTEEWWDLNLERNDKCCICMI